MARAPGRPGFLRSLPLPNRNEGVLVLVVLLVTAIATGAAIWYANTRAVPAYEPREGVSAPATSSAPTEQSAPTRSRAPVLAFYGDWFVSGTEQGGIGEAGWPAIVSRRLGAEARPPHAAADAGYVAGPAGTFLSLARDSPEPTADVTIVFGGRNDYRAGAAEITAAATATFEAIRTAAPDTALLVIGPAWNDADVPPELPPVRDAIRQAAAASGATFLDPLEDRWFVDDAGGISSDLISPTDEGHAYLADRIEPVVRRLLPDGVSAGAAATP